MRPAVFLDRDDTLIANRSLPAVPGQRPGDLADPARVELLPGAHRACQLLKDAGHALVIITNQGVVARGGATLDQVNATNDRVCALLAGPSGSSLIDAVYCCPYHPQGSVPAYAREHPWRKPAPGMLLAAADDLGLDLTRSWLIGDAPRDRQAGIAAGLDPARCLLIADSPQGPASVLDAARIIAASCGPDLTAEHAFASLTSPAAPLADEAIRSMVVATARAIAERTGIELLDLRAQPRGIEATIAGPEVVAVGFVAELRRLTNAWHRSRTGRDLWPSATNPGEDQQA